MFIFANIEKIRQNKKTMLLYFKYSLLSVACRDAHNHSIVGDKRLNLLRPLHQAQIARIEILLISQVEDLLNTVDTIEVEVVDAALRTLILIDQSKRWSCNGIFSA
jgi:hypothetical protein